MMRDNGTLDRYPEVIRAMREVVEKGGYGTSVTPVSQFYFQQAYSNVMFGAWKKITEGYGKMVLGYFGKTPVKPDPEIVELASKQLGLEPTSEHAIDIADKDEKKSVAHAKKILENEGIETTEENIFIAASCKEKGIAFLKGEAKVNVRKKPKEEPKKSVTAKPSSQGAEQYTVVVNGKKYNVEVNEGFDSLEGGEVSIKEEASSKPASSGKKGGIEIKSNVPGAVVKVLKKPGDEVEKGESVIIIEAMKMEIDIVAEKAGIIKSIDVNINDTVVDGQLLATME